jgi:hypothetical protein
MGICQRAESLDLRNKGKQEILEAISKFLDSHPGGKMGFEKNGEAFSWWAIPESEKHYLDRALL